jgi:GT2 family glycosyltransferase
MSVMDVAVTDSDIAHLLPVQIATKAHHEVCRAETTYPNARYDAAPTRLSIASPYFEDNPIGWIKALCQDPRAHEVEIVVVDDGSGDVELDRAVRSAIDEWPGPAVAVRLHHNSGRAQARNRCIAAANGTHILFIDADMVPGDEQYLTRYFDVIEHSRAAIAFGGFTVKNVVVTRDTQLNYSLAMKNDCKPAAARALKGPLAVASNNLLVRKDVLQAENFDSGFQGWGWEDTEWAMRAVFAGYGLIHIDNPAVHVGLDTGKSVLRKYKEAGRNLRRLLDRHPEGQQMAGAKVARWMAEIPLQSAMRPVYSWIALDQRHIIPIAVRRLATQLWRASHAAQALRT